MTEQQRILWDACTNTSVNIGQVIAIINAQPQLLKDAIFKAQLIAKVAELEENSPVAENAFQYTNFQYTDVKMLLNGKIPLRRELQSKETLYAYLPHNSSADTEEYHSQKEVSERFFRVNRPLKAGQAAEQLYQEIKLAIQDGHTIILDGRSTRSIISALTKIIAENSQGAFPAQLKFRIGNTNMKCDRAEVAQRTRQKANLWLSIDELPGEHYSYGSYKDAVGSTLNALAATPEKERRLSELMTHKTRSIQSFNENEFNQYAQIRLVGEQGVDNIRNAVDSQKRKADIANHIHYLNGLNFLRTITEVTRRLYRENDHVHHYQDQKARRSDAVPVAVFQARTATLLANNTISQKDVFGESAIYGKTTWEKRYGKSVITGGSGLHRAKYGVATGSGTIEHIDVVEQKAKNVNDVTEAAIVRPSIGHAQGFFKPAPIFETLALHHPEQKHKAGKNYLRKELGNEFGGDYESDDENYSDDEGVEQINNLFGNFGM